MFDKMKQLMEMKKQADKIKRELDASITESDEGRGIKITINGAQYFQSIEVNEDLLTPDRKTKLESELLRSINGAVKKSQNVAAQKMKSVLPGGFPGL